MNNVAIWSHFQKPVNMLYLINDQKGISMDYDAGIVICYCWVSIRSAASLVIMVVDSLSRVQIQSPHG